MSADISLFPIFSRFGSSEWAVLILWFTLSLSDNWKVTCWVKGISNPLHKYLWYNNYMTLYYDTIAKCICLHGAIHPYNIMHPCTLILTLAKHLPIH